MEFIKLHDGEDNPVYINPAHIVSIRKDISRYTNTLTDIETVNNEVEGVQETIDEVIEEIRRINHVL